MSRDEVVAFFARHQEALNRRDAAALAADYAPDCIVESPAGGRHEGREAVQAVMQAIFDAFMDMTFQFDELLIDGSRAALVLTFEGTLVGTFLGVSPTGKHFKCSGVFLYELREGQIV